MANHKTPPEPQSVDRLTGVLSWEAMEAGLSAAVGEGGGLFLCDIWQLGEVNRRLGHAAGDACLRQAAQLLGFLIREGDLLGRAGEDEFAVFLPDCLGEVSRNSVAQRIRDRFRERRGAGDAPPFSVTVGAAIAQKGDTAASLVERARADRLARREELLDARRAAPVRQNSYRRDARKIREELAEEIRIPGAYCRDYETFRSIYRFLERGIIRSGQKSCVILLSLTDREGQIIPPEDKDRLMDRLGEDIRHTLRLGDVYTRYTSSQYLILAMDTTEDFSDVIVDRIKESFLADGGDNDLLVHYCYQMRGAAVPGQ